MWSVHEILDAVPSGKESMLQNTSNKYPCMPVIDDWEEADLDIEWDEYCSDPKVEGANDTATH